MAEGEERENRRHPQNLEGVLRFCIENTKSEDVQDPGSFTEMSEEGAEVAPLPPAESNEPEAGAPEPGMIEAAAAVTEHTSEPEEDMASAQPPPPSRQGKKLSLKRCKAIEDLDDGDKELSIIEELIQSSGSSGDNVNDAASDTASLAESLPDIEAARRNQDHALATLGLYRYKIPGDGNCMFRAVSSQLNLDQEKYHGLLRQVAVKWMRQHIEELLGAGLLDNDQEIDEMVSEGSWPNQAALVALSNVLSMNIAVIQGGDKGSIDIQHITPITPPSEEEQAGIKLAYLYNGHYDSVVNEPNLSNPTYALWAAQSMKENCNLSKSTEDLLQENAREPYLPYAEYKSPWHRKDNIPEGDPRRSLSHTPDFLDSDCSGLSEAEEEDNAMPTVELDNVVVPDVAASFVSEVPESVEEMYVHMKSVRSEQPEDNVVHFKPVVEASSFGDRPKEKSKSVERFVASKDETSDTENKEKRRRSALFIMLGSSQDDSLEQDSYDGHLSKSRSLGDLGGSLDSELLGPMAENVKEHMVLPDPVAENSSEILTASPPRTIKSPPILQAPVRAKIFPARKPRRHTSAKCFAVNVTEPSIAPVHLGPSMYQPSSAVGNQRDVNPRGMCHVSIPPPHCVSGKALSPTVRVLPIRLNGDLTQEPSEEFQKFDKPKVHLKPVQASIKAEGPVKITIPKEGFIHGVTDPNLIKVEERKDHLPKVQQMNYVWVTPAVTDFRTRIGSPVWSPGYPEKHAPVHSTHAHSSTPPVEQLWEKNMWSRSSPAGQSSHSEAHSHHTNAGESAAGGSHGTPLSFGSATSFSTGQPSSTTAPGVSSVNTPTGLLPAQQLDFSRSTQTNLKLSHPVFLNAQAVPQQPGGAFNLDKFLSPLRRDVDADYIESLLKQQWFR